jgi:ribonuclease P protein component
MLPKKKRITKELFADIIKKGRVVHGSLFLFRYIKKENPHYAFVAPKAVAKSAVERNRLRRRGYAALRLCTIKPIAGIFFYKKIAPKASFVEIKKDIDSILNKSIL